MNTFRRAAQAASLCFFLALLWAMGDPALRPRLPEWLPADLYLRLDPLVAAVIPATAREWIARLAPGLAVIGITLVLGRVFCGWFCPFGATLDLARFLGKGRKRAPRATAAEEDGSAAPPRAPMGQRIKYFVLAGIIAAALFGVNAVFAAAPIPLITRFYSTFIYPVLHLAGKEGLDVLRPLLADSPLAYAQIPLRRFDAIFFILVLFGALFALEQWKPRFWCRYVCPAGALLGLFSRRALWRRRVLRCIGCGQCRKQCPTGAIDATGANTAHQECISCLRCEAVCPAETRFSFSSAPRLLPPQALPELPGRRAVLQAGIAGVGCALGGVLGLDSLTQSAPLGVLRPGALIRPPGAVPEPEFLRRCLRCGACMQACPSNTLQPVYFIGGVAALFSPVITPRRGPCEAGCNACGQVCPSRALRPLPLEEKQCAKTGTAFVLRQKCLAWEQGRRCVVCQEVCPYGAISLRPVPGADMSAPPAPVVRADRCFGCGACECHCPVASPAIVVEAVDALRLESGSYIAAAREARLTLELVPKDATNVLPGGEELPEGALPPGFTE